MQDSPQSNPQNVENVLTYDPLKWPPEYELAVVHMKCVCPGKDNVEGIQCPCCGRYEKITTSRWVLRDILKDFKSYGGGVPSYFQLLKYCGFSMLILAIIVIFYHVYILETTCPKIHQHYAESKLQLLQFGCQQFLVIFKLCDSKIIFNFLISNGQSVKAYIFYYLQLFSFVYLIAATIGMKIWLQRVNEKKIIKEDKVYSYFSLMIKNIPKYYQIQDVRKQLQAIVPAAEICQLFFVYEIAELEQVYKRLFDLHFQIEHKKQSIASETGATTQQLTQLINRYGQLYQNVMELKSKLILNNGRAIAVFNNVEDRNKVYSAMKINQVEKFFFHSWKIFGYNTEKQRLFADKISQPQQIIWKYIGQSSVTKTWVRIKTTGIGFGFMIACFLVLYFPIIKIDENNIQNHGVVSSVLSILISLVLQVLAIVYRQILLKIVPSRHPSSRQSQSYFIVITTVVFHFFFYIIAPGTYFLISKKIPANIKIKQLFVAVLMFLIMTVIVAFIDLRYRIFNGRRKKIMSSWAEWGKFCQARLHQQIRWPGFPIQFKLMVILNIWSFNAFYVFQIPYLMILFVIVIIILYLVDKKNIYRHYKMQVYQSIDLQLSVQRDYIVMFLICVSGGYAVCDNSMWHYIFVGIMFVISLLVNWLISYRSKQKQKRIQRTMTLAQVAKAASVNPKQSMLHQRIQSEFKQNALILDNASTVSLGSATLQYGYKQLYDSYINQFKNKRILSLLQETYTQYKNPNYNMQADIQQVRRVTQFIRVNQKRETLMKEQKEEKQKSQRDRNDSSHSTQKVDQISLSFKQDQKQEKK